MVPILTHKMFMSRVALLMMMMMVGHLSIIGAPPNPMIAPCSLWPGPQLVPQMCWPCFIPIEDSQLHNWKVLSRSSAQLCSIPVKSVFEILTHLWTFALNYHHLKARFGTCPTNVRLRFAAAPTFWFYHFTPSVAGANFCQKSLRRKGYKARAEGL